MSTPFHLKPLPVSGIPGYVQPIDPRCEFCGEPAPIQRTCGKRACRKDAEQAPAHPDPTVIKIICEAYKKGRARARPRVNTTKPRRRR